MRAAVVCCLAGFVTFQRTTISDCASTSARTGATRLPAQDEAKADPAARVLAKQFDEAGFATRITRGLDLIQKGQAEIPRILLAKYYATKPESKFVLALVADRLLSQATTKANRFPLAWAKEGVDKNRWGPVLELAVRDRVVFDRDARKVYTDALKQLWAEAQKLNPHLKARPPSGWGEYLSVREETVSSSVNSQTLVADRLETGAWIGDCTILVRSAAFLPDTSIQQSYFICTDDLNLINITNSVVITSGSVTVRDIDHSLVIAGGVVKVRGTSRNSVLGAKKKVELGNNVAPVRESVFADAKQFAIWWASESSLRLGETECAKGGGLVVIQPPKGSSTKPPLPLRKGDVAIEVNGWPISATADADAALARAARYDTLYLTVLRDGTAVVVSGRTW